MYNVLHKSVEKMKSLSSSVTPGGNCCPSVPKIYKELIKCIVLVIWKNRNQMGCKQLKIVYNPRALKISTEEMVIIEL